jgi:4-alpha-glucanotransferase
VPPFAPSRLQELGYEPFAAGIRATMTAAGGLRVDHVMGLFRLWWIPEGASPSEGAYVRYPAAELLDVVALESQRASALVVGEDLGTVEDGVREELAARDILSYKLLWFEGEEPARWPARSLAAVTTHDLPTVAGLWTGSDLADQRRLGLAVDEGGTEEVRRRLAVPSGLADDATPEQAVEAAHELLAKSPSALLSATLEDAIAEEERPNVPGADAVRPNWSLALSLPLEELARHPLAQRVARVLGDATRGRDTAPR